MSAKFWSSVGVAIESAAASAVTIDSISKASPGVVGYTGTDPVNGDYVKLTVQGMHQLDGRVVRVANVNGAGNTFELEGVDTTLFDTFVSGTFEVLTFGTTLGSATGLSVSGGEYETADTTTIHDAIRKVVPTIASPLSLTFECLWDPADAALIAFKAASDTKAQKAVRITFADGAKVLFNGFVGASLIPAGSAQEKVTTTVVITAFGRPTAYSS